MQSIIDLLKSLNSSSIKVQFGGGRDEPEQLVSGPVKLLTINKHCKTRRVLVVNREINESKLLSTPVSCGFDISILRTSRQYKR